MPFDALPLKPPADTYNDAYGSDAVQSTSPNSVTGYSFSTLVRAGIAGEAAVLDLADLADPQRVNKWPTSRNPYGTTGTSGFATTDGLHESPTMAEIMRDAGFGTFSSLAAQGAVTRNITCN